MQGCQPNDSKSHLLNPTSHGCGYKAVCCYDHKHTKLVQIYCIEEQMLFILIYESYIRKGKIVSKDELKNILITIDN